jgi:hypothetical protein
MEDEIRRVHKQIMQLRSGRVILSVKDLAEEPLVLTPSMFPGLPFDLPEEQTLDETEEPVVAEPIFSMSTTHGLTVLPSSFFTGNDHVWISAEKHIKFVQMQQYIDDHIVQMYEMRKTIADVRTPAEEEFLVLSAMFDAQVHSLLEMCAQELKQEWECMCIYHTTVIMHNLMQQINSIREDIENGREVE